MGTHRVCVKMRFGLLAETLWHVGGWVLGLIRPPAFTLLSGPPVHALTKLPAQVWPGCKASGGVPPAPQTCQHRAGLVCMLWGSAHMGVAGEQPQQLCVGVSCVLI